MDKSQSVALSKASPKVIQYYLHLSQQNFDILIGIDICSEVYNLSYGQLLYNDTRWCIYTSETNLFG